MIIFIIVLLFDLLIMVLDKYNYYLSFFKPTGIIVPSLLTIISLYLLAWAYTIKKYWVIAATFIVLIFSGKLWLDHIILENSYDYVNSPDGNVTLLIEHRNATLGETNHFYNFYRTTAIPMVIKKISKNTVVIVTRNTSADNLTVLGINNVKWSEDNKVIFGSPFTENGVEIKY